MSIGEPNNSVETYLDPDIQIFMKGTFFTIEIQDTRCPNSFGEMQSGDHDGISTRDPG